ncbi:MAG: hypothetical protein WBQ59_02890, partial [Candidatus Acidiferrum sp.]
FAHFPNEGLISLVVELKDGKAVEAGLVGNEGATGMPAILGLRRSPLRGIVQIAGNGFRVRVDALKELLPSTPKLSDFELLCGRTGDAGGSNGGMQPAAQD